MKKIRLEIIGITQVEEREDTFILILEEEFGKRRLPIYVGKFEAQAIAIEIEKIVPTRPLTHDLFKLLSNYFNFNLKEVVISEVINGRFLSTMIWTDGLNDKEMEARPSDAIAIALRMNTPIYSYEEILNQAGVFDVS